MTATPQRDSTSNTRHIAATPEALYRACTDPAMLARWRTPGDMTGTIHHFDLREGGGYAMSLHYPDTEASDRGKSAPREDRFTARFVELSPPHRIVEAITFETTDPAFAGELRMAVSFAPAADGTLVTIAFTDLPPGIRPEDNELGTRMALEKLARSVEHGQGER
jgi:uncharacterized protein YndB with AHSA1/START domain